MKDRTIRLSYLVPVMVCCLLLPLMVSANVGRDYGESVRALSKEDWQKAELKIRDALTEVDHAEPSMELSGGVRYPYMPWYVLGSALQGQGDCAGAVTAWQRSLGDGVVQSSKREYQLLQSGMQQCESRLAQEDVGESESTVVDDEIKSRTIPEPQTVTPVQDDAAIAQTAQSTENLPGNDATESSEREKARIEQERIEEQRRRILLAQRQEAERRKLESEKLEQLAQVRTELRTELDRVAAAIEESHGDGLVIDARVRLVELSNASSSFSENESAEAISRQVRSLQAGLREYRQVAQEWQAEQQAIAHRTPPPGLKRVAEFYFAGNYGAVSQETEPASFTEQRYKVQAYLFRSAARFNLFWLQGESDPGLIESARSDIEAIKRLDTDFQPYVAAFSPKFLAFFRDA